jgi:hypothetical protein
MVTHYTLQTKDHKIATSEQDLTIMDLELVRFALQHYYQTLERNYERFIVDEQLPEMAKPLKETIEKVRQLRRKLDGND